MKSGTKNTSEEQSTILRQHRYVLGKVVRKPSDISVVTKKCYTVTADYYDTRNKENTFNAIRSNQSQSPSPDMEAMLRHENDSSKYKHNPEKSDHSIYQQEINENNKKGCQITITDPPSAFEAVMTPRSKWNKSFLGGSDAPTPRYGLELHLDGTDTRGDFHEGDESDACAHEEEAELVSILKYSLISNRQSECRSFKGSPPLISGRENPAIPTEEIFEKGLLK